MVETVTVTFSMCGEEYMITIKDVAKEVNVSVTTISRVLNNKPDVSEATKKKVEKAIEKMGYNPNKIAQGLVLKKSNSIGLIIPDINNPFFPELIKGVERTAKKLGYSLILCNTDNDKIEEKESIFLLRSKQVDGIILSLSLENKEALKELEKERYPIVQIDRRIKDSIYPAITIDNKKSAYIATEYLIKQGHRKIGHITGDLSTETAINRFKGFRQALKDHNISYKKEWLLEGDYSIESGKEMMENIIKLKNRPTALFLANDLMAFGAYETIFKYNYSIPEDFSIIGHDNIEITSFVKPGLTTMDQPKYRLGEIAAKNLIKIIENKDKSAFRNVILKNAMIVRDSIKPLQ